MTDALADTRLQRPTPGGVVDPFVRHRACPLKAIMDIEPSASPGLRHICPKVLGRQAAQPEVLRVGDLRRESIGGTGPSKRFRPQAEFLVWRPQGGPDSRARRPGPSRRRPATSGPVFVSTVALCVQSASASPVPPPTLRASRQPITTCLIDSLLTGT